MVAGLQFWQLQIYSITPGLSQPVNPLMSVKGLTTDHHTDRILLTDVYLTQLNALTWIIDQFRPNTQLVTAGQLVAPGVPTTELDDQGYLEMYQSKLFAKVAALDALGWKIPIRGVGAQVNAVTFPSAAYRAGLRVADQVVAVDGHPVASFCSLVKSIDGVAPHSAVALSVQHAAISYSGSITLGAPQRVTITTVDPVAGVTNSALGCAQVTTPVRSVIDGASFDDAYHFTLPGRITIRTPLIGGPSAGLAMTLTLIDKLSAGSLTGGRVVAATGTIDQFGRVGDVGGVAEKTIAVERAGASVFIVPQVEVKVARNASNGSLTVLGVTTLHQALTDLRRLGGVRPVPLTKPYTLNVTS